VGHFDKGRSKEDRRASRQQGYIRWSLCFVED
jgi:hypothetical protein